MKLLGKNIKPKNQLQIDVFVGLVISFWLYIFLTFIGPFDAAELSIGIRSFLMIAYALIFFLCYLVTSSIQNTIYRHWPNWEITREILFYTLFFLICIIPSFLYYKSDIVNGTFSIFEFLSIVYFPIILIATPIVYATRHIFSRSLKDDNDNISSDEMITLCGNNAHDIIKIQFKDLVALEAANNYVAVHYLRNNLLQKKLLRVSLKKIHESVPEMVKTHRSYLINPIHFIEWNDNRTLTLTQLTVPVSQNYKKILFSKDEFTPK